MRFLNSGARRLLVETRYEIKKILAGMPPGLFLNLLTLWEITGELSPREANALRETAADILDKNECIKPSDLKINGGDLINAGIPKGKAVGRALAFLLDEAHKNPEINERDALLKIIGKIKQPV